MRFLVVLASVILAINAATDKELWSQFKLKHGREYRNLREEQVRFSIFKDNLRTIEAHNEKYEKGEKSYYMGVNQFSDMTPQEFKNMLNYSASAKPVAKQGQLYRMSNVQLADEVNWISGGYVTEVKNQGSCGSCWAFSAIGALEGAYKKSNGVLISFSEQELVDCNTANAGCDGGAMQYAFDYIGQYGIETESDYPYEGVDSTCRYETSQVVTRISTYVNVPQTEDALADAVANAGPQAVAINADHFQNYAGGVFDESSCDPNSLDHGVVVVGYGTQNSLQYWLVKNSWGSDWGENGYVKMVRNKSNQCGIANDVSYPIV